MVNVSDKGLECMDYIA